ncbi:MAG: hypothetical protein AAF467_17715 [Actinomycetota bacterium]
MDDVRATHRAELSQGCLVVDFCGMASVVDPGDVLSFGRKADIEIDDNPYLHRVIGRFECLNEQWWVANTGARVNLNVVDRESRAKATVPPATRHALVGAEMIVRFVAGRHSYELLVYAPDTPAVEVVASTDTAGVDGIAWTDDQRLLMTILAEDLLRGAASNTFRLPTNRDAQGRLGWSETTFNRKLDTICDRLSAIGVRGVERGVEKRNTMRRHVLADYAVNQAIVSEDDLATLAAHEQQVASGP